MALEKKNEHFLKKFRIGEIKQTLIMIKHRRKGKETM